MVALGIFVAEPSTAEASGGSGGAVILYLGAGYAVLALGGTISGIALTAEVASDELPGVLWLVSGAVFGLVDTAVGAGLIAGVEDVGPLLGAPLLAIGLWNVVMFIWGLTLEPEEGGEDILGIDVAIAPAVVPTPGGELAPGLAVGGAF